MQNKSCENIHFPLNFLLKCFAFVCFSSVHTLLQSVIPHSTLFFPLGRCLVFLVENEAKNDKRQTLTMKNACTLERGVQQKLLTVRKEKNC